jgi:8-oxo-dGTP diphosphatase
MIEVAAALIFDGERFMICRRPANKARGLLWEFVGGKLEPGETGPEALVRECREELAVTVKVGEIFMSVVHEYPDITIRLTVYRADIAEGTPQLLEHSAIRWITPGEIPQFSFCPADKDILAKITETYGRGK